MGDRHTATAGEVVASAVRKELGGSCYWVVESSAIAGTYAARGPSLILVDTEENIVARVRAEAERLRSFCEQWGRKT